MSFKIGFEIETERKEEKSEFETKRTRKIKPKKSVVDVFFPDKHLTLSYYNDSFDLKVGDWVYVDGKLEGFRGRVNNINYNFKIKLSDYQRVISVVDFDVKGEFYLAGTHFFTTDKNALNFDKASTWFNPPEKDDEEYVISTDDEMFNLQDLGGMKIEKEVADRGYNYYLQDRVMYIEIDKQKGKAIVKGSKNYLVEFKYQNGDISELVCSCFCTSACKHQFATMLQLKDTLEFMAKNYPIIDSDYVAIINKIEFFKNVIDNTTTGCFSLN